mgnify:CR=1 FL=1
MENSLKQEFTRRLTQCNSGEMIVIMYDIVFAYMDDAKKAYQSNNYEEYKAAVKKSQGAIDTLIGALNFKYDLARDLHKLYMYSKNCLAKAIYQNRTDGLEEAEKLLKQLYASFCEAAKSDTSGPLMRNTQQVYAGMTYGRTNLNEEYFEDNHRGFFV